MKFGLIDEIIELTQGKRIVAVKAVSLAEEYLADHFPTFPVLPGVLMLQSMVEAATWLVRDALDFTPDLILLRQARNVTYRAFCEAGQSASRGGELPPAGAGRQRLRGHGLLRRCGGRAGPVRVDPPDVAGSDGGIRSRR